MGETEGTTDPQVAGVIFPSADGAVPLFKILRHKWDKDAAVARACEHGAFILDDRWNTVTCGKCKEKVDPFAALLSFATWWEDFSRKREEMVHATKRAIVEDLLRLRKRRAVTPEEAAEMDTLIRRHRYVFGALAVEELAVRELSKVRDRMERAIAERGREDAYKRRSARRRPRLTPESAAAPEVDASREGGG